MEPPSTARRTFEARIVTTKAVPSCTRQEKRGTEQRCKMSPLILNLSVDPSTPRSRQTPRVLFVPYHQLRSQPPHRLNLCGARVAKTKQMIASIMLICLLCRQRPAGRTKRLQHKHRGIVETARLEEGPQRVRRSLTWHH